MILIDPRAGSVDYIPLLRQLGAPVDVVQMEFGDVAFEGSGRAIGIEVKKLNDMLNCITTGRFSGHQLPGLARDYQEAYLIVEGIWRPSPLDGVLETFHGIWTPVKLGKKTWMYRDVDNFLTTIDVKGGVRVKRTSSANETARSLYDLYLWWQDYDGHRGHLALSRAGRDAAIFVRPTFARRVAAELPGIGFDRSGMLAGAFPTVRGMLTATVADWRRLPGIGKKLATQIVEAWDSKS